MAGRVHHVNGERANSELIAIRKQSIELTAISGELRLGVQYFAEHPLHAIDSIADANSPP